MNGFVIGTVLEPEVQQTQKGKKYISFGLLVGKTADEFSIWDDSKAYDKAASLRNGDRVVVICNSVVSDRGQLRTYVNNIAEAPEGLRETLLGLFKGSAAGKLEPIPEPPVKK